MKALLGSTLVSVIVATCTTLPLNAQSSGCYMIDSSGQTLDLSSLCGGSNRPSPRRAAPVQTQPNSSSDWDQFSNETETLDPCFEFESQPEAQEYMRQRNATELDPNRDGIACEHILPRELGYGELSRQKWDEVYHAAHQNRGSRLTATSNRLTLREVEYIMGFRGVRVESSSAREKWRWRDIRHPRVKIDVIFIDNVVHQASATGLSQLSY